MPTSLGVIINEYMEDGQIATYEGRTMMNKEYNNER